jgi:hypothetical protein
MIRESDLAHLAVADDVNACLELLVDRVRDGLGRALGELRLIDWPALCALVDHLGKVVRTRETPRVCGQNAARAALHGTHHPLDATHRSTPRRSTRKQ